MKRRVAALALVFSGFTALVYEIIWTRLLGFAFGTTTEAIGTVLAVFFGGMAIGNWLAARRIGHVARPLRVYALLELGIGAFALGSLPLLLRLDALYAVVGVDQSGAAIAMIRLVAAALVLLPPTIAMGATLPVVARGVVASDDTLGRWSAILYAANTLGAVSGAYLCGFWLIPAFGLAGSVILAGAVNLLIASGVFAIAGRQTVASGTADPGIAGAGRSRAEPGRGRTAFLVFFGISGFVAIGYEMVWSKLFGIVMEGTLHGFAAVLSAYLFGIGAGSLAISPFVDRIRDLPRSFGLLHAGIALAVAAGMALVPFLPYANGRLVSWFEALVRSWRFHTSALPVGRAHRAAAGRPLRRRFSDTDPDLHGPRPGRRRGDGHGRCRKYRRRHCCEPADRVLGQHRPRDGCHALRTHPPRALDRATGAARVPDEPWPRAPGGDCGGSGRSGSRQLLLQRSSDRANHRRKADPVLEPV
jgi:spermidine synthase